MDSRDAQGRRLKVHKLQQPGPLYMTARGSRGASTPSTARSRATGRRAARRLLRQFLHRATRRVVMPLLDPRRDTPALRTLQRIFPERDVIGVQAREILLGGGNIHCITQQVPRARGRHRVRRRDAHASLTSDEPAADRRADARDGRVLRAARVEPGRAAAGGRLRTRGWPACSALARRIGRAIDADAGARLRVPGLLGVDADWRPGREYSGTARRRESRSRARCTTSSARRGAVERAAALLQPRGLAARSRISRSASGRRPRRSTGW